MDKIEFSDAELRLIKDALGNLSSRTSIPSDPNKAAYLEIIIKILEYLTSKR